MRMRKLYALFFCLSLVAHPQLAHAALRLIVLDSSLAEIIVALGQGNTIVAVSSSADYIPELAQVPKLAGYKQGSSEALYSLTPTHIVQTTERLHTQTRAQLERLGVKILDLTDESSIQGATERIQELGTLLGQDRQAQVIAQQFDQAMQALAREVQTHPLHAKGIFILAGGGRPTVAGGSGTHAAALLEWAGIENIASTINGYKVMNPEALLAAAPDFILTNQEGLQADRTGQAAVLKAPGVRQSAVLLSMPSRYLQTMGLSTAHGVRLLRSQVQQLLQRPIP